MGALAIRPVDLIAIDEVSFVRRFVGCIVLTHEDKILLQQRDGYGCRFPNSLGTFGGNIEKGETPMAALVRELREELGAHVDPLDVVPLGAFTEGLTEHNELIYGYFWQDMSGTITGYYEGKARTYNNYASAFDHPKIMDDVRWLLQECRKRDLI